MCTHTHMYTYITRHSAAAARSLSGGAVEGPQRPGLNNDNHHNNNDNDNVKSY